MGISPVHRCIAVVGVALSLVLLGLGAAPAFAASPEYSTEGTCAVVKLHPDDVSEIASVTASLLTTSVPQSVSVDGFGPLDAVDLGVVVVLGSVGLGVAAGSWGRSRW